jgi:hypothetical protein
LELNDRVWRIIQTIKDIERIDAIIWALTGAKKCSTFPDKKHYGPRAIERNIVMLAIETLGLEFKDDAVQTKDWPDLEQFVERYRKPNQGDNLAAGLYYDIPYCCAEAFHKENNERMEQLLAAIDCPQEVFEQQESNRFFDKILKETTTLILAGQLPPSVFLLMGQIYVPCSPTCEKFVQQAEKMFKSLVMYLGKERADSIVKKYKERITKIYK